MAERRRETGCYSAGCGQSDWYKDEHFRESVSGRSFSGSKGPSSGFDLFRQCRFLRWIKFLDQSSSRGLDSHHCKLLWWTCLCHFYRLALCSWVNMFNTSFQDRGLLLGLWLWFPRLLEQFWLITWTLTTNGDDWLLASYPTGFMVLLGLLATNVAGSTKRSMASGMVFVR